MKGGIFLHIRDYMKYRPRVAELLSELPDELLDTILIRHYKADDIIISHCEHNTDTYLIPQRRVLLHLQFHQRRAGLVPQGHRG